MSKAIHPIVDTEVCNLPLDWQEAWEERAGVIEFEANHQRILAEALALILVLREMRSEPQERQSGHLI